MLDPAQLRGDPEAAWVALARRGHSADRELFAQLSGRLGALRQKDQELREQRNEISAQIGKAGADADPALRRQASEIASQLRALGDDLASAEAEWRAFQMDLPNLPDAEVPEGQDESDNRVLAVYDADGNGQALDWQPASGAAAENENEHENENDHDHFGQALGMYHPAIAARLSGARFSVLTGPLAQMHRALGQFFVDLQTQAGYLECWLPWLVQSPALEGTGQLPKFEEDLFAAGDGHYLLPTAEVALVNLLAGEIVAASRLPVKLCAQTGCFRSEAGSYGRDTRGLIRQHQFEKVELVQLTWPEDSEAAMAQMLEDSRRALVQLRLPHRVVALCAGDMSFAAARTLDLEVWMPGQRKWREIASCSNCRDFQTRRLSIRGRPEAGAGKKPKPRLLHSLNSSALPLGRCLAAIMENHRCGDELRVPQVLQPYMGGLQTVQPEAGKLS